MNLFNIAAEHVTNLQETAWRMVETQDILATRKLVDSAIEHEILEEIIKSASPHTFGKEFAGLHALFYTPFQSPSLPNGSRFGSRTERSIWYGSLNLSTVLAEKAYYQFLFLKGSKANLGNVLRTFMAFSAPIKTSRGLDLTALPFSQEVEAISSPMDYKFSQSIGSVLRNENIEAFCYQSARDPLKGTNIGIITPRAFSQKKPIASSFQTWQSLSDETTIEFMRTSALASDSKIFSIEQFHLTNILPLSA